MKDIMGKQTKKEIQFLMNFIEEFSWISRKYRNIDLEKMLFYLNNLSTENKIKKNSDDKSFLIGNLPSLLLDRELFSKNKDLSDFAKIIGIEVRFPEKRSRDEIIGTIICTLQEEINPMKISKICKFIEKLINETDLIEDIKKEKKYFNNDYDWNRVIRFLYMKE